VTKASRRGPGDTNRRIFGGGYPLIIPLGGSLQRGVVFVCFGRSLSTQFEFVVRGWINNPDFPRPGAGRDQLKERIEQLVIAGGYFFVPSLQASTHPWSWLLPK